jgi:putative transposase
MLRRDLVDGQAYVNAVIDCADRECIGLNVSQRNDAREAAWTLLDALIRRVGALPNGDANVILRTDNALVYASELYRALAKSYGIQQEFILSHTPRQKWRRRVLHENLTYDAAKAAITAWVKHYNEFRPHSGLGYQSPTDYGR